MNSAAQVIDIAEYREAKRAARCVSCESTTPMFLPVFFYAAWVLCPVFFYGVN